jgi:hypothetical protein
VTDEVIKLILDYVNSSRDTEELTAKLKQLSSAGRGVADTFEVLDDKVSSFSIDTSKASTALDAQTAAAVEATRAQKVMARTLEELNQKKATFGKLSRENQLRILEFGRATQDFAQGGLMGVINNIERLVGGGGVAAGLLTVLGTAILVGQPIWKEWFKTLEEGKQKIPDLGTSIEGLTEKIKKNKDAIEDLKKQESLGAIEMDRYKKLVQETKDAEAELEAQRQMKALKARGTKADRARGAAFTEALAEYGGPEKLFEEMNRSFNGGLDPKRAREMILDATGGKKGDVANILVNAPGFGDVFQPINPDLDAARKAVREKLGGGLQRFGRNVGIAIKGRQKAAKEAEKEKERLEKEREKERDKNRKDEDRRREKERTEAATAVGKTDIDERATIAGARLRMQGGVFDRYGRFRPLNPAQQQGQLKAMIDQELRGRFPRFSAGARGAVAGEIGEKANKTIEDRLNEAQLGAARNGLNANQETLAAMQRLVAEFGALAQQAQLQAHNARALRQRRPTNATAGIGGN